MKRWFLRYGVLLVWFCLTCLGSTQVINPHQYAQVPETWLAQHGIGEYGYRVLAIDQKAGSLLLSENITRDNKMLTRFWRVSLDLTQKPTPLLFENSLVQSAQFFPEDPSQALCVTEQGYRLLHLDFSKKEIVSVLAYQQGVPGYQIQPARLRVSEGELTFTALYYDLEKVRQAGTFWRCALASKTQKEDRSLLGPVTARLSGLTPFETNCLTMGRDVCYSGHEEIIGYCTSQGLESTQSFPCSGEFFDQLFTFASSPELLVISGRQLEGEPKILLFDEEQELLVEQKGESAQIQKMMIPDEAKMVVGMLADLVMAESNLYLSSPRTAWKFIPLPILQKLPISEIHLSANGRWLSLTSEQGIEVWDLMGLY